MKSRVALTPFLLLSLIFVFAYTLSASGETGTSTNFTYLPSIIRSSNQQFSDDFSDDASGWPVGNDGDISRSYQDGEYEILIHNANWWTGAKAPISIQHNNYSVEADMRRHGGTTSDYGLVFGWKDWDNFYFFVMDPASQWYGVAKVENGKPKAIVPHTSTTAINPNDEVNHLKVERKGDEFAVYTNGHHLTTVTESGFGGVLGVGLYMESDADAPASVRYDNFEVWRIETGKSQGSVERLRLTESAATGGGSCETTLNWCFEG